MRPPINGRCRTAKDLSAQPATNVRQDRGCRNFLFRALPGGGRRCDEKLHLPGDGRPNSRLLRVRRRLPRRSVLRERLRRRRRGVHGTAPPQLHAGALRRRGAGRVRRRWSLPPRARRRLFLGRRGATPDDDSGTDSGNPRVRFTVDAAERMPPMPRLRRSGVRASGSVPRRAVRRRAVRPQWIDFCGGRSRCVHDVRC